MTRFAGRGASHRAASEAPDALTAHLTRVCFGWLQTQIFLVGFLTLTVDSLRCSPSVSYTVCDSVYTLKDNSFGLNSTLLSGAGGGEGRSRVVHAGGKSAARGFFRPTAPHACLECAVGRRSVHCSVRLKIAPS